PLSAVSGRGAPHCGPPPAGAGQTISERIPGGGARGQPSQHGGSDRAAEAPPPVTFYSSRRNAIAADRGYPGEPMHRIATALIAAGLFALPAPTQQLPHAIPGGYELPNGWRLTPLGRSIQTEDMVLNVSMAPDQKALVALHSGFNPH